MRRRAPATVASVEKRPVAGLTLRQRLTLESNAALIGGRVSFLRGEAALIAWASPEVYSPAPAPEEEEATAPCAWLLPRDTQGADRRAA